MYKACGVFEQEKEIKSVLKKHWASLDKARLIGLHVWLLIYIALLLSLILLHHSYSDTYSSAVSFPFFWP